MFFDRRGVKYVVLIGKFERPDFKYDRFEIKRRLERLGVNVEDKVSLRTDFVLLGKEPETNSETDTHNYNIVQRISVPVVERTQAQEYVEYYLED